MWGEFFFYKSENFQNAEPENIIANWPQGDHPKFIIFPAHVVFYAIFTVMNASKACFCIDFILALHKYVHLVSCTEHSHVNFTRRKLRWCTYIWKVGSSQVQVFFSIDGDLFSTRITETCVLMLYIIWPQGEHIVAACQNHVIQKRVDFRLQLFFKGVNSRIKCFLAVEMFLLMLLIRS